MLVKVSAPPERQFATFLKALGLIEKVFRSRFTMYSPSGELQLGLFYT